MLSDAAIERYSRQILLGELGGRGQARLLGTTVAIGAGDAAATFAADLLARAGVHVTTAATADGPCVHLPDAAVVQARPTGEAVPAAATAQLVGALLAGETLTALLGLVPSGRTVHVDLAADACRIEPSPRSTA